MALWVIVNMMKYPGANMLVIRKTYRTLHDSCFKELKWAIHRLQVDAWWEAKESPLEITYKPTGQKIYFRGLDDPLKTTSITVEVGSLCWCWFEEAYEITNEDDFSVIDESIRGQVEAPLFKQITLTLNPWSEKHWIKARFFDSPDSQVFTQTTNYLCNEWLDDADYKMFERMRLQNPRRYLVAGLGEWGIVDGLVYENWKEQAFDIKAVPGEDFAGLDWGYSNDPAAVVIGKCDVNAKVIYIWDEIYKTGLTNSMLWKAIQDAGHAGAKFIADSAEPKSIADMKNFGAHIEACTKGKDSVINGIQWLQDYQIIVHPRCVNTITELSLYSWKKDKTGKSLNEPEDANNHIMDALRYGTERFRKHSKWIY